MGRLRQKEGISGDLRATGDRVRMKLTMRLGVTSYMKTTLERQGEEVHGV